MSQNDPLKQDPEKKLRFWKAHIQQWGHSGLSQVDYCEANGLVPHRFTYWKKRLIQHDTSVSFAPIQITANLPVKKSSLNLLTPNGYTNKGGSGFDPDTFKQIVGVVNTI